MKLLSVKVSLNFSQILAIDNNLIVGILFMFWQSFKHSTYILLLVSVVYTRAK
jgi:hypothetical protein